MIPDAEDPRVIVDRLHAEIAAISPEHAALVAAFEQIPRPAPRPVRAARPHLDRSRPRTKRMRVYAPLRLSGAGVKEAARKAGIGRASAWQYEADLLAALGGEL